MLGQGLLKLLKLDGVFDAISAYIEARIALIKLEIREEIAAIMSRLFLALILIITFSVFFLFLNLGISLYLNSFFEDYPHIGFLIVAGFYLLVFIILMLLKKTIGLDKIIERKIAEIIQHKEKENEQQ